MKIYPTFRGRFVRRLTRFSAEVYYNRGIHLCYLPNPGRLRELLKKGRTVLLKPEDTSERKTDYDLVAVFTRGEIVPVDSRLANQIILEALQKHTLPEFSQCDTIRAEYIYKDSRFDFLLSNRSERCLVEVKSCTLFADDRAFFPDAPTERGVRHLSTLIEALDEGYHAYVIFVVNCSKVGALLPNDKTDPHFGRILRQAAVSGVELLAYLTSVKYPPLIIKIGHQIPVVL